MTIRESVKAWPLYWPPGWERAKARRRSAFKPTTVFAQVCALEDELDRLGAGNRIVSTNLSLRADGIPRSGQRTPEDPGVSVWFELGGEERVLACDRWDQVEHNIRAIALHIDAIRGQARWGVGSLEQAFRGFVALPAGGRDWWDVLECRPDSSVDVIRKQYRARAFEAHPDRGGSRDKWDELRDAYESALEARS